jgi:curved DNA-binding protein CbpA
MKTHTHYELLEISEKASQELVDAAWKVLMRRFHPDGSEPNSEKAVRINQAHDVLADPKARAAYDAQLRSQRVKVGPRPVRTPNAYPEPYPPAYGQPYPGINLNPDELVNTFIDNLGIKRMLADAGCAVLERIARDNPVIAELLRKQRKAG